MRIMPFTHRLRSAFNQRRWLLLVAWLVGGAVYASPSFHEYATLDKAMDQVFPNTQVQSHALVLDATQITAIESSLHQRVPTDHVTIYTFSRDQQVVGHGMVLDELGKHYPMTFFVGVDIKQRVKGVVVFVPLVTSSSFRYPPYSYSTSELNRVFSSMREPTCKIIQHWDPEAGVLRFYPSQQAIGQCRDQGHRH